MATILAVGEFNMGSTASHNFMASQGLTVGRHTKRLGKARDNIRQGNSRRSKEAKQQKRREKIQQAKQKERRLQEKAEGGPAYGTAEDCSQERHSDYNLESSQSLFTSIGTTVAEGPAGDRDSNLGVGDGTTQLLEDSSISQTMFGLSQGSVMEEPEEEAMEVEKALQHTINTLCERLTATADLVNPALTSNLHSADSMEAAQAVLTEIPQQAILTTDTATTCSSVAVEEAVNSRVRPPSDENGVQAEKNKSDNSGEEDLTHNREENAGTSADYCALLSEHREAVQNQCEENCLVRDDCRISTQRPCENLLSKAPERPKVTGSEAEEKGDREQVRCPGKDGVGEKLSLSKERTLDITEDTLTTHRAVSASHSGRFAADEGETNSQIVSSKSTSLNTSQDVAQYPYSRRITHKFNVPYCTKSSDNFTAPSVTAELSDQSKLVHESNSHNLVSASTESVISENSNPHTSNDSLGLNEGGSKERASKSKTRPSQEENGVRSPTEMGDSQTCATPRKIEEKNSISLGRLCNRTENALTEKGEDTHQKKHKDSGMNRDKKDRVQNERGSDENGLTMDGNDRSVFENTSRLLESQPSRRSGHSEKDHEQEVALLERFRQLYDEVSGLSSSLSTEEMNDLTDTADIVIREISKRQGEEKTSLANRVKRGKMTSSEKAVTKQRLQRLTERCAALQAVFKIHREMKRRGISEKPAVSNPQTAKTRSDNRATETCSSPCKQRSTKQKPETTSSVQPATKPNQQAVQSASPKPKRTKIDEKFTNNIPANEPSPLTESEIEGEKERPSRTVPSKPTDSVIKNQDKSKRDVDTAENSSVMSQSILQPIPKTNLLSSSRTSKPFTTRHSPQKLCQGEISDRRFKLLLESEVEMPDSASFDDVQKPKDSLELAPQEAETTKIPSKSDSGEHSKPHSNSSIQSPLTVSSEGNLQSLSQNSLVTRKQRPPLVSVAAKNRWLPNVPLPRAENTALCFEDDRQSQEIKKCQGPDKTVETQEVDMDVDDHTPPSPVRSGQGSTNECGKENPSALETRVIATSEVSPSILRHSVNVKATPAWSADPQPDSEPGHSASMSPGSTQPPDNGSVSPDSSTKSLSLLQNPASIKPRSLLFHSSPEREDCMEKVPGSSALLNSMKRNGARQHSENNNSSSSSSSSNINSNTNATCAQSNDAEGNKTAEQFSSSRKRSRKWTLSLETASDDSVAIVHVSPRTKCRKTEQEISNDRQKSSSMPSSDYKGKISVTGSAMSGDHAPQKKEIQESLSLQKKRTNVGTLPVQNAVEHSYLLPKKMEDNITSVTLGTAAAPIWTKGFGAGYIITQEEQIVSEITPHVSDGQILPSRQTVQTKQTHENPPATQHQPRSIISNKRVPEVSRISGPHPAQNPALKPSQAVAAVVTGRKPATVHRDVQNSTVTRPAPPLQIGSSPSSSMTTMTGVFPVSSKDILRKMAQDATRKKQEGPGLKPPPQIEPAAPLEDSRRTTVGCQRVGASSLQVSPEESKTSKLGPAAGDEASLDGAGTDLRLTPGVLQKQLPPGTRVIVVKQLRQGCEKTGSVLEDGRIQDVTNLIFSSPLTWFRAITGMTRAKRCTAYSQIMYRGRTLEEISSGTLLQVTHPPTPPNNLSTTLPQPTIMSALPGDVQPFSNPQTITPVSVGADKNPPGSSQTRHENSSDKRQTHPETSSGNQPASRAKESEFLSTPPQTKSASESAPRLSSSGSRPCHDTVACLSSSKLIASLRKLRLIEEQEVISHASSAELVSFWSADFAEMTMTPGIWATVDDWDC
ncbi:hypothetical protein ACOMHN_031858 [Nucella lapillus]